MESFPEIARQIVLCLFTPLLGACALAWVLLQLPSPGSRKRSKLGKSVCAGLVSLAVVCTALIGKNTNGVNGVGTGTTGVPPVGNGGTGTTGVPPVGNAPVQHKIRLRGIDAPEKKQPFGRAAGRYLSGLVANREVRITYAKRDRYQRILGMIYLDGRDVNLEMLKLGHAWHYKKYDSTSAYAQVESEVRAAVTK